jgi:hypothetical protein
MESMFPVRPSSSYDASPPIERRRSDSLESAVLCFMKPGFLSVFSSHRTLHPNTHISMFRSALRSAIPRTARNVPATAARRWASTGANHGSKSSDMTWLMGSVAVFGSATAYLLMSGGDSHPAHVAVHQGTTHMKEFHDETNDSKVPEDANTSMVCTRLDY